METVSVEDWLPERPDASMAPYECRSSRNYCMEELADVLIYAFLMGNDLGFDIPEIVSNKIRENDRKYPAEKAYGKSAKYTDYTADGGTGK